MNHPFKLYPPAARAEDLPPAEYFEALTAQIAAFHVGLAREDFSELPGEVADTAIGRACLVVAACAVADRVSRGCFVEVAAMAYDHARAIIAQDIEQEGGADGR